MKSVVTVQKLIRGKCRKRPSSNPSIRGWYKNFMSKGCVCKGKAYHALLSAEELESIRQSFSRSLHKSPKRCFGYVMLQAAPTGLGKAIFKVTFLQHNKEPLRSKLKFETL